LAVPHDSAAEFDWTAAIAMTAFSTVASAVGGAWLTVVTVSTAIACALNGLTGSVPDQAHSTAPDLPVELDSRVTGVPMSPEVATFPYKAPNRLLPEREARSCVHPGGGDQSKSLTPASLSPPTRSIASPACTVPGTVMVRSPEVTCASALARNAMATAFPFHGRDSAHWVHGTRGLLAGAAGRGRGAP